MNDAINSRYQPRTLAERTRDKVNEQLGACQITGGQCDPSYGWSAGALARMIDEVKEAAGLPIDATHTELVKKVRQCVSDSLTDPRNG